MVLPFAVEVDTTDFARELLSANFKTRHEFSTNCQHNSTQMVALILKWINMFRLSKVRQCLQNFHLNIEIYLKKNANISIWLSDNESNFTKLNIIHCPPDCSNEIGGKKTKII